MIETYCKYFGISQDTLHCENCQSTFKAKVILIDPDLPAEYNNLIYLCGKCVRAFNQGFLSRGDLRYLHEIFMNKMENTMRKC